VKIGVDDQASSKVKDITSKLGNGLKTAAKVGTAAVGVAASGIVALTKQSLDSYAEYEQLVGGAELMFGKAFDTVKKNAQEAYKTVQMSQNEYLTQVNGFATGLKTALGGNEQAAANLAHRIVKAEADIIAATGNSAENVQNAFNGIMRSNFSMLDNLQIGITPTKEGFQDLIDKVNDWNKANGRATKYQMGNLADMQSALVDYIKMQGYAGYAQDESARTIQGSLASAKSAWTNLITGMSDKTADLDVLISNFVESVGTVAQNIIPKIGVALKSTTKLISDLIPVIVKEIPKLIDENLPMLADAAVNIVQALVTGLSDNQEMLMGTALEVITTLLNGFLTMLPQVVQLGLELLVSLANGIAQNLPTLIPTIVGVVLQIVEILTKPENLNNLLTAALEIVTQLAWGLIDAIPQLIDSVFIIVDNIVDFLTDPVNLGKLIGAAIELVIAIGVGIIKALPNLLTDVFALLVSVGDAFKNFDWASLGINLVNGFANGISRAWGNLKEWFKNLFGDLVGIAKRILGIASPSKVFRRFGIFVDEGLKGGIQFGAKDVFKTVENLASGVTASFNPDLTADYTVRYNNNTANQSRFGALNAYNNGTNKTEVVVSIDDSISPLSFARYLLPFLKVAQKEAFA
jgi:phage-related protein